MSDDDLIRRGDALSACRDAMTLDGSLQRIAALPAVKVGVSMAALPRYVCTDLGPRLDPIGAFIHVDDLAALEPVTQPAPDVTSTDGKVPSN